MRILASLLAALLAGWCAAALAATPEPVTEGALTPETLALNIVPTDIALAIAPAALLAPPSSVVPSPSPPGPADALPREGVAAPLSGGGTGRRLGALPGAVFRHGGFAAHDMGTPPPAHGFGNRLVARLNREALRFRRERPVDLETGHFAADSVAEEQRAREAERILSRGVRRTVRDQVEQAARTGLGLEGVLDRLGNFELFGGRRAAASAAAPEGAAPRLRGTAGFRIGAHPRLVLGAEFLGMRGRLEVPVLDNEVRLSVERPLGIFGRAALTAGLDRDGRDWYTLGINLSF